MLGKSSGVQATCTVPIAPEVNFERERDHVFELGGRDPGRSRERHAAADAADAPHIAADRALEIDVMAAALGDESSGLRLISEPGAGLGDAHPHADHERDGCPVERAAERIDGCSRPPLVPDRAHRAGAFLGTHDRDRILERAGDRLLEEDRDAGL